MVSFLFLFSISVKKKEKKRQINIVNEENILSGIKKYKVKE